MTGVDAIKLAAWEAHRAGLCVVPPREDGSKRPEGAQWTTYQGRLSTLDELRGWYSNGRQGVGVVTGKVSGNLETFEFDDRETYDAFIAAAEASGLGELIARIIAGYEEESPGAGIHWPMYCAEIAGNTTLARRPLPDGTRKTLIQTRGEGGYIVLAPSGGRVHPTGKPYLLRSGALGTIARVTPEERAALWRLARTFDETPAIESDRSASSRGTTIASGTRPGDDFAARTDWAAILEPHGWVCVFTRGDKILWRRPGKDVGISATTNYAGSDYLYVFSTSTVFDPERGYSKFSAFAILNHGGDFAAAASELARQGYGERRETRIAKLGTRRVLDEATGEYTEEAINPNDYPHTDTGNSLLFAALYAGELRHDHRRGEWLRWHGHWWGRDDDGHARRLTATIAEQRAAAATTITDERDRKAAIKWAFLSQSRARRDALLTLAADEHPLTTNGANWDGEPFLFGVANGVLDLRTGVLLPGSPDERITMHSDVAYDSAAVAPRWSRFLSEVFRGDADLIAWLRRVVGYSLTGSIAEHVAFFCYGSGSNGKSTLLNALGALLGEYATTTSFTTLERAERSDGSTVELAALAGRRLVTASETTEGKQINEARLKSLTGGDPITARFLYQNPFTFRPVLKLWLAVNHKPEVGDDSVGFWRRVRLIPFLARFEGQTADKGLEDALRAELPGILAWAVQGCLDWQRSGLGLPAAVADATSAYREESDPISAFLAECCTLGDHHVVRANTLYKTYDTWAAEQGQREKERLTTAKFGRRLGERFEKSRDGTGNYYKGLTVSQAWIDRDR